MKLSVLHQTAGGGLSEGAFVLWGICPSDRGPPCGVMCPVHCHTFVGNYLINPSNVHPATLLASIALHR